nr:phosphoribosylformylglycinamidine synthase subunit PurQ [Bacteroidales bacterium]
INIPTGKDSLSMTQKYPNGSSVISPGTVIVSAGAHTNDFTKVVRPVIKNVDGSSIYYISFSEGSFELGGSAFAQLLGSTGEKTPKPLNAIDFRKAFNAIQSLVDNKLLLAGHDVSSGGLITTLLELCFSMPGSGLMLSLDEIGESDIVKVLLSENPGVVVQTAKSDAFEALLKGAGVSFTKIGGYLSEPKLFISLSGKQYSFDIDALRTSWFKTSYLLDKRQSGEVKASERFNNFSKQPLAYAFPKAFKGTFDSLGINPNRTEKSGLKAAIIREKGVNGDREMAFMLHLAGFDVKDVHMTDLISGRETLDEVRLIVFVGGFSNSDVLGSAKGWAGAFKFNEKAKESLDRFFARKDTLSLGVCNGCQLMIELGLITPGREKMPRMLHNDSHKFESAFLTLDIQQNHSVMLSGLAGSRLGIWVAHGEGKFSLPESESAYHIPAKYAFENYPGNPNGSDYNTAALCSEDGRHLAIMPHLERAFYPWHWAYYPETESSHEVSPWMMAFTNAREWLKHNIK